MPSIGEVKRRHEARLLGVKGVVGVGVGLRDGRECITVLVRERHPALQREIPAELEGFPTYVEVVGDVRARR